MMWAMCRYNGQNFIMAGKTVGAFRRNVLFWLKLMLKVQGYKVKERRADNLVEISKGETINYFYVFGGKDERSQDLIQGITAAGAFLDEVVLMPESFVTQALARCSVDGAKYWFTCNPEGPYHWFKKEWIDKAKEKNLIYLHFTMDDNLSLSEETKERYKKNFVGVFYKRFILGLWVIAEGAIYQFFADHLNQFFRKKSELDYDFINIGIDFGGNKSAHAFVATGIKEDYSKLTALMSEKHKATGITPDELYNLIFLFIQKVRLKYGEVAAIYVDSAEQTLKNGIKARIDIPVKDSIKNEIIDRIRATTSLMSQGRFFMTEDCESLKDAFMGAVYNPKSLTKDERLDDGTSDIDTLDAFEYSWEKYITRYEKYEEAA